MKNLFAFLITFLTCISSVWAQTNANIPGPENVLVVYKMPSDTTDSLGYVSEAIKNYYVDSRDIPASNILSLELPRKVINLNDGTGDHVVKLAYNNEHIQDSTWAEVDSISYVAPKFHAWLYFLEEVADKIKEHLVNNNLTSTIRYIVMCQGVPYKLQARGDHSTPANISIDGLLCMLNTANYHDFIQDIFNQFLTQNQGWYGSPFISNPYLDKDSNFNFNARFKPNYYSGSWSSHNYKLSYLISRLDGLSLEIIKDMIDKSVNADKSGEAAWIIDNDLTYSFQNNDYLTTKSRLENHGFNVMYENTNSWVSHNTYSGKVMGYTSLGTHAEGGDTNFTTYIQDSLLFDYANGSVFNSYESFNARSIGTLRRAAGQGLMTEFTLVGGTSGVGHSNEPFVSGVVRNNVYFPYYAMGYNQIDAAWQGMQYLAWRNVVVGDPLTTIAWSKQQLAENLNWEGTNLVTGEIDITNHIITIEDSSVINLRHQGFITGDGKLMVGNNVTFNIYSWQKGLFLSYDSNNPRLVWGEHPTFGSSANYNIYRKIDTSAWSLLAQTTSLEYTDTEMLINLPGDLAPNLFYKILASSEMPGYDTSNTVQASAEKGKNKITSNKEIAELSYSLDQNYPNPFNPETRINYVIKENGLVQLTVYNILGQTVKELVNEIQSAGSHSVSFNAADLPSGVYIYKLKSGDYLSSKKMLLLK